MSLPLGLALASMTTTPPVKVSGSPGTSDTTSSSKDEYTFVEMSTPARLAIITVYLAIAVGVVLLIYYVFVSSIVDAYNDDKDTPFWKGVRILGYGILTVLGATLCGGLLFGVAQVSSVQYDVWFGSSKKD
jgi:hypothetical protein